MINAVIIVVGVLGSLAMIAAAVLDRARVAVAVGIGFLFVLPVELTSFSGVSVQGVAQSHPEISTFAVATVVFAAMSFRFRDRLRLPVPLILFTVCLAVGMLALWDTSALEWSGTAEYLLAPAGWLAGTFLVNFARESWAQARFLVLALLTAISVQAALGLLQIVGVNIHRGTSNGWRVSAALGNPNTLGEVAFLALLIFLPFSRHASSFVARSGLIGIVVCFLLFSISGGRSNFIAGLAVLGLWAVLVPRLGPGTSRRVYLAVLGAFSVVAYLTLFGRFQEDPTGSSRVALLDSALRVLPRFFWQGMGPNDYLTELGRIDPSLSASGLPVHNSFLLVLIELGVVGAALLFLPWVLTFARGCATVFFRRLNLDYARLAVCAFLPMALIAMTDKGPVTDGILPLWFLVVGMCTQGAANDERTPSAPGVLLPGPLQPLERWFAGPAWAGRFHR